MNEILKKKIEEAAYSACRDIADISLREQNIFSIKLGAEYALSRQWISVEEALPEANEHVLTLIGGVPVVAKGYHVRARMRDISHWMPIPKFEPNKTE